jgi:hypothetical protein
MVQKSRVIELRPVHVVVVPDQILAVRVIQLFARNGDRLVVHRVVRCPVLVIDSKSRTHLELPLWSNGQVALIEQSMEISP